VALLLDSSVLIEAERRHYPLSAIVALAQGDEALGIAAVSVAELLLWVHLTSASPQRESKEAFVEDVIDNFTILDFDLSVARVYSRIWASLRLQGNLIAPHDLLIGATGLYYRFDVLTHNVRDFGRIQGLIVRRPDW
jgi:tRNA(fMet)-specific endonuclease VapC